MPKLAGEKSLSRPRVVIIDDSRTVQAMLEQIFINRLSCNVVGLANNADEGLALIQSCQPDIVTIDINMPGRDGLSLLSDLRDHRSLHRIVVASNIASDVAIRARAQALGADASFDKRVFTGQPGSFCAEMRSIISQVRSGRKVKAGGRLVEDNAEVQIGASAPPCPVHHEETERLRLIVELDLANLRRSPPLDLVTSHLATVTDFPACLLTIIDREVQWVKSAFGFKAEQMSRAEAICSHTICQDGIFAVPNTMLDARFAGNPLVTGSPGLRSYFGCPIVSPCGVRLGALCLVDLKPRKFTPQLGDQLRGMAAIVSAMIAPRAEPTETRRDPAISRARP